MVIELLGVDSDARLSLWSLLCSIDLFPNNGGSAESVKEDFEFFTTSGSLDGDPAKLKVEDYWYLEPVNTASEKLGKM